jgi:hypothetical protein
VDDEQRTVLGGGCLSREANEPIDAPPTTGVAFVAGQEEVGPAPARQPVRVVLTLIHQEVRGGIRYGDSEGWEVSHRT